MNYLTAVHTDVGIRKSTNQDSVYAETADTDHGEVAMAVVCDGMGGLAKGEVASAVLIRDFVQWFHCQFPAMLYGGIEADTLRKSWEEVIRKANTRIAGYGRKKGVSLGTTVVAVLLVKRSLLYYQRRGFQDVPDQRFHRSADPGSDGGTAGNGDGTHDSGRSQGQPPRGMCFCSVWEPAV